MSNPPCHTRTKIMKTMTTNQNAVRNESTPNRPQDYAPPSPEQIEDIRKRLAGVPPETLERVHQVLKHDTIDAGGSLLWKAGISFTSAELYEYRKTLFPPNALVDAYTSGPPVLRDRTIDDPSAAAPEDAGRGACPATAAIPADPSSSSPPDRGCVPQEP